MFKCEKCSGEFKSNAALSKHTSSCKAKVEEVVAPEKVAHEVSEKNKRKLEKLRDAWKSTPDAEARHNIELQIKEIEG